MAAKSEISTTRVIHPKILYYGTPVVLLTTVNPDESCNITPMSSAWALGDRIILGLGEGGQGFLNLKRHGECVVNLPGPDLWSKVERLAPLTGMQAVPAFKQGVFRYEKDKFGAADLTPVRSMKVKPVRIGECGLQLEAIVKDIRISGSTVRFGIVEVEVVNVHAHEEIVIGNDHVDPKKWSPLIYNFRHYFGLGQELGQTFRAEV